MLLSSGKHGAEKERLKALDFATLCLSGWQDIHKMSENSSER